MEDKSRPISLVTPEYVSNLLTDKDNETEDFPATSSTVIHAENPLDEERFRTPVPDNVGRRVAGSSKVADTTEEKVAHLQKFKNPYDEHTTQHSDDQLEVSQERAVRAPQKIADPEPTTELEDGRSIFEEKFKPVPPSFPKSNKGTCARQYHCGLLT